MLSDDAATAVRSLRELARWVMRDRVDSDHLDRYMRSLLSDRLIELHAVCRLQAMEMSRNFGGLPAQDVAAHLCECACELERACARCAESAQGPARHRADPDRLIRKFSTPAAQRESADRVVSVSSWIPEFVAAVVFGALAVAVMECQCDNFTLRAVAGGGYGLLGVLYAGAALNRARQNARTWARG